jgi:hypothetical protein
MNCKTCVYFREGPPAKNYRSPFGDGICTLPVQYITDISLDNLNSYNSGHAWMAVTYDHYCAKYEVIK